MQEPNIRVWDRRTTLTAVGTSAAAIAIALSVCAWRGDLSPTVQAPSPSVSQSHTTLCGGK